MVNERPRLSDSCRTANFEAGDKCDELKQQPENQNTKIVVESNFFQDVYAMSLRFEVPSVLKKNPRALGPLDKFDLHNSIVLFIWISCFEIPRSIMLERAGEKGKNFPAIFIWGSPRAPMPKQKKHTVFFFHIQEELDQDRWDDLVRPGGFWGGPLYFVSAAKNGVLTYVLLMFGNLRMLDGKDTIMGHLL